VPPAVSQKRAQQLFDLVNRRLCCPASASAPCIPFLYPDDGCWGRAHEMCRLMIADGAQPEKVWIKGNLHPASQNHPGCAFPGWGGWGWHVAPTLQVNTSTGVKTWVIDPALFNGPTPQASWKGVQGDPSAVLKPSGADMFFFKSFLYGLPDETDPTYAKTNLVLANYRNNLKLRSAGPDGPPPYFACMTKPPGVQWFGSLAPNQTKTWFTWGWVASLHVLWTIMPLTPCPGAPQLTWRVSVERANSLQCTYWITVTNLTSDPVKFEGRYNVL
jgi:hypothetical protein